MCAYAHNRRITVNISPLHTPLPIASEMLNFYHHCSKFFHYKHHRADLSVLCCCGVMVHVLAWHSSDLVSIPTIVTQINTFGTICEMMLCI